MRGLAVLLLLLGACGERGIVGEDRGVTENLIERVSTPRNEVVDQSASARLQPLAPADLVSDGPIGPGCAFSRNGRLMLTASSSDAIARIDGRLLHFVHSSPVNASGGFFEDRQLSISVGRVGETAAAAGETGSWPARLTVTNRRHHIQAQLDGVWRCGG
jgi:hypothetical protein